MESVEGINGRKLATLQRSEENEGRPEGCTEETSFKEERWKKIQEDPGEVSWWTCDNRVKNKCVIHLR